ncbi:hypothetical protein KIN20_015445, partial [Parelaphostrongylus tenuis]
RRGSPPPSTAQATARRRPPINGGRQRDIYRVREESCSDEKKEQIKLLDSVGSCGALRFHQLPTSENIISM